MPVKTTQDASTVLNNIYNQRRHSPLSILALAEPIAGPDVSAGSTTTSDHANPSLTPASLSADLTHYRDLFSKLRFSYLEQVTKEKYLRSIVGDPPIVATAEQNAELELKLAGMKEELQAKKRSVEQLVTEMEELARQIAVEYDGVNLAVQDLEVLPAEVEALERDVLEAKERLAQKEGHEARSDDPRMHLSSEETEILIQEQRLKNEALKRKIEGLERDVPGKTRECEEIERELGELERRRNEITRLARDAQRLREAGGRDALEEQGRWYQGSEAVLRGLLGVQS